MKPKYILENYDRILKEIKNPKIIFSNDLTPFLENFASGSFLIYQVDFIKQDKNFQEYSETIGSKYLIKFNGSTVGYIDQYEPIETLYKNLMKARAVGKIAKDCSITVDHFKGLMNIWCDEGRIMSPFVSVANCFEISGKTIGIRPNFRKWLEKCAVEECFDEGVENMFIQLYDAFYIL